MDLHRVIVVGNGMVGHKLIECLVEAAGRNLHVTAVAEEPRLAYDRVNLSSYFAGTTAEQLSLAHPDDYRGHGVRYVLSDPVAHIDRAARIVTLRSGNELVYDSLVLATGSTPFVPPIAGRDQPFCHVYRTIEDLEAIRTSASQSKVGVVIGGGLLGLEAANALKSLGLETHVVEFAPRLMAVQLDPAGATLLKKTIAELGVGVHTDRNTREIADGENRHRYNLRFEDGDALATDMVVFSAGIRPRDELARAAGLDVGARGGIVIDNTCKTSDPHIYAIGECALWNKRIFGLVAPGYQMARVAAARLTGGTAEFTGADMSTKLKLLGIDVASIGDSHGNTAGALSYIYCNEIDGIYKKLVVSRDGKRLLGAVLVGDASAYGTLQQLCINGITLPGHPEQLILPVAEGGTSLGVADLPLQAQICSCHDVSKGALCDAIAAGEHTLAALKQRTRAGTGCGGCTPSVTQILNHELSRLGVEVNNHLCEHFPYSRQQLFDILRVKRIRTFRELLTEAGSGYGCDICKPAVASMLASYWNEYILKEEHAGLQDTNDHFLANMQKNGTYSVIPRVPGGEITPDKLIAIGEVAREFNLYAKITGAQRIDLLGAEVHQLPDIWQRLIDAGFETGHAYGKALRTVKSCVGSTWCRYGVQDSVAMAINLENRYKGLRSPHKLKMAVSGCTRECAEAQSKDIGVIATEHGWNLYVCGNGGMRPRHADLFATQLDDATLVRYIDLILMFYVRTADRLQRTSVWLENLDGGLGYLKQVTIEDSLGICAELQADMERVVDTYQCEWKTTVEDPEKLKRFRHHVNSQTPDRTLRWVTERGQKRPALAHEVV